MANSAHGLGRARAEFPPSLATSASIPIDPAMEVAWASSGSASSSSCSALARSSSRLAVSRLAFASATRRTRSADETSDFIRELLELWIIVVSLSTMCGIVAVVAGIAGTALPR